MQTPTVARVAQCKLLHDSRGIPLRALPLREKSATTKGERRYKMQNPKEKNDLAWVTARISQQNETHTEKQQTTPRTGKCAGCGSTKRTSLAYQVTACKDCIIFMQEILIKGLQKLKCNNKGAGHKLLSTPEHPSVVRKLRSHCTMHRLIQLLTKGFNGPQFENWAIGGNKQIHKEMRKALFIGSVKVAGDKYGFHQTQNSTSIDKVTQELHMTEECTDLKQLVGSLAQLQHEQPQLTPKRTTLVPTSTQPSSTVIFYTKYKTSPHRVFQLTPRASYTHKTWDGEQ